MRSQYDTLLSLFEWGSQMGIDPYELAQVGTGFPAQTQPACASTFMQYSWQQNFLSRDEVALSIQKAENLIANYLGYYPAPKYFYQEKHLYPRPVERYLYGAGTTKRWQWKPVALNWTKVQNLGLFKRTLINGAGAVIYSDPDGDGVTDLFTVTVPTTVTDPTQIAVYYTLADRLNADIDETWRIRPVNVAITGGNAVITGHQSLCVKPSLEVGYGAQPLDVTTAANFITSMEVYQVYTDTSSTVADPAEGVAHWEPFPNDCSIGPCSAEEWPICANGIDATMGMVGVDYLIAGQNSPSQNREPDLLFVNYLAGVPRQPNGRMDAQMADIVAHLATSLLPVDKCGCERSQYIVHWWRSFPGDGTGETRPIAPEEIDQPFGQTMGGLYAWRALQYLRSQQGVSI